MSALPTSLPPPNPHMYSGDEEQACNSLPLYSEYQRMDIELRSSYAMPASHRYGQAEINVPFDGDVEYLINNEVAQIKQGHITLFWACVPYQLTRLGSCQSMAIFNLPTHLSFFWPLDHEPINHTTHGTVIRSLASQQSSTFEIQRWQQELSNPSKQVRQLAIDETGPIFKRFSLSDWQPTLVSKTSWTHKNSVSQHAQFYVSQMLSFVAGGYGRALTINDVVEHVKFDANYAMGIFQRVMQLTLEQYITAIRINHVRALLSDTDKTIFDVALTAGFRLNSCSCDAFSKFVGTSPRQYHKLSQQHRRTIAG